MLTSKEKLQFVKLIRTITGASYNVLELDFTDSQILFLLKHSKFLVSNIDQIEKIRRENQKLQVALDEKRLEIINLAKEISEKHAQRVAKTGIVCIEQITSLKEIDCILSRLLIIRNDYIQKEIQKTEDISKLLNK